MAKPEFKTVTEYIAAQPPSVRAALRSVRNAIRRAIPQAEEAMSYRIPAYKVCGGTALYFAAWKKHYSIYPASRRILAALTGKISPCQVSKGTIRFPLAEPVPVKLIERIARLRGKEAAARVKAKQK